MSDAPPDSPVPPPYSRPHDPRLCDYVVTEGEEGGEASSTMFTLVDVPEGAQDFDSDEETGAGWARTMIGQAATRAPAVNGATSRRPLSEPP
jgi:hypothetical protein